MNKLKQNVRKEKHDKKESRSKEFLYKLTQFNKSKATLSLLILLSLTVFFGAQLNKLRFNYSFDSFFPKGDDELEYYEQFNNQFGQYNDFLFVVLKSQSPLTPEFASKVQQVQTELEELPETENITSPYDLKGIQINPLGINSFPLVNNKKQLSLKELKELGLYGSFFGKDNKSVMLFLRHQKFTKKPEADAYFLELKNLVEETSIDEYMVSGKIQMQYDFTQKLENELGNLLILSLVVVFIILLVMFRSVKGLILPLLVLIITLIWTMGFMALTGKAIDVMVVMIPAILLIVALSDVIHFIHKFDEQRKEGQEPKLAIQTSILTIGKATFLTSATTAIGFLGLLFLPIEPIREFGLFTATGVILAFIITFLSLPALLIYFPKPVERPVKTKFRWPVLLKKLFVLILKRRRTIAIALTLIALIITSGIINLKLSTSLIVGLQKDEPELRKVAYFDEAYDGYKPFELGIVLDSNVNLISESSLKKISQIEDYIQTNYGVKHIQSPLNIVREINAGLHGGSRNYYSIPQTSDLRQVSRFYNSPRLKGQRSQVETENGRLVRVLGRTKDLGSGYYQSLNDSLNNFLEEEINGNGFEARLTGASYLIDKTDQYVVSSLLKGLVFALISVSFFILIFFKSWKLSLITLIPNLIPIALLFGLMGFLGVELNISTAIIFTVALGIAIDDSIHFIARFKLENLRNSNEIAIKNAFVGTGKSIIVTSLVIILGFSVFLSSGFSAAYYLGFFIVLAAIIAVVFDLSILPLLLQKKKK